MIRFGSLEDLRLILPLTLEHEIIVSQTALVRRTDNTCRMHSCMQPGTTDLCQQHPKA